MHTHLQSSKTRPIDVQSVRKKAVFRRDMSSTSLICRKGTVVYSLWRTSISQLIVSSHAASFAETLSSLTSDISYGSASQILRLVFLNFRHFLWQCLPDLAPLTCFCFRLPVPIRCAPDDSLLVEVCVSHSTVVLEQKGMIPPSFSGRRATGATTDLRAPVTSGLCVGRGGAKIGSFPLYQPQLSVSFPMVCFSVASRTERE